MTEPDFEVLIDDQADKDKEQLTLSIRSLISAKTKDEAEKISINKNSIIELLHDDKMRKVLSSLLNEVKSPQNIADPTCFRILADVLRYCLSLIAHASTTDNTLFFSILEVSNNLYQEENGRKKPLSMQLRAHGIWVDCDRWRDVIESVLKAKIS